MSFLVWAMRARLAGGSGKWQSSGGEKSKFGLAATRLLQLVETRCVKPGVSTACNYCTSTSVRRWRIFAISPRAFVNRRVSMWNCTSWSVNIQCFDVGGGLGVDYEYSFAVRLFGELRPQ